MYAVTLSALHKDTGIYDSTAEPHCNGKASWKRHVSTSDRKYLTPKAPSTLPLMVLRKKTPINDADELLEELKFSVFVLSWCNRSKIVTVVISYEADEQICFVNAHPFDKNDCSLRSPIERLLCDSLS
ncbi:hypothetical protein P7K49_004531 [Saguinus oedipus]|uniref:Uncharacterized protein n=1 Tax=Saguinus oedipus TaxID=9490 RepID=A0ABQ9W892_SAGOE|nr:hypothetical protein P7K49_004531 [Saguinus oedipus]